jgi:1A family penicillin-binding protein
MTPGARFIRRVRFLFYLVLTLCGVAGLVGIGLFFFVLTDLPRVPHPLSRIIETPPTEIYAATGERIMVIGGREVIPLNRVSHHFIQAVVATEDHRFWEHHGVDKLRTIKALWVTFFKPGKIQGASTITQQLAKNLFFSFERTWSRKFQEMLVAVQIESGYSKEEILEAYVNQIAFGVGAFGIEQASRTFFGVPASDLTLPEAALLAGLPKSPTRYNPYRHLDRARLRQEIVLRRMATVGYITPKQAATAAQVDLSLQPRRGAAKTGSYFLDGVINDLEARYGAQVVYHGGLRVTTTLDPQMQSWAVESVGKGLSAMDRKMGIDPSQAPSSESPPDVPQGALVAVETNSGAIKAMVGGRDYQKTEFNRAVQNNRLPGSGFKPFLYYTAFERAGLNPATVVIDRPVIIPVKGAPDWTPENFERSYDGPMIIKRAFTRSVNSVAAQVVERTGPESVIRTARRCGIKSHLTPVYSVALGTSGVSPVEMAGAFATFATGGIRHDPFMIWRVEDPFGRVLEEHIIRGKKTLDPGTTYQVLDMMRGVVDGGTGRVIRRLGFSLPAAGKTGTTNDFRDAWFTGFTPTMSVSIWVGFDRQLGLRDRNGTGITGGRAAAPIWADFMLKATEGDPPREFPVPPGLRFESVDPVTGKAVEENAAGAVRVVLKEGQTASGQVFEETPSPEEEAE